MKRLCMAMATMVCAAAMGAAELTSEEKQWLAQPLEAYREAITPPEIARAFDVHRDGCPVCKDGIKKHGSYSWIIDEKKPYKLQCPECKSIFPDNDFAAYFKSGCRDQSLLTGKYVDPGRGWKSDASPGKYWFVAYYNHWTLYPGVNVRLPKMAAAYARTGNPDLARRALVTLDRVADYYRDYNYNTQSRYAEEIHPQYSGRIVNSIWETFVTASVADAFRNLLPFLELESDPELTRITGKTPAELRNHIEENLLRVMANDIMSENGRNSGNFGMHQCALLKIALALRGRGGNPDDRAMVRWVTDFRKSRLTASVPFDYVLYNNIFGDGAPMESPGYNQLWIDCIAPMVQMLREYGIDYAKAHPVSARLFTTPEKLVVCGIFTPSSGDAGSILNRGVYGGNALTRRYSFASNPCAAGAWLLLKLNGLTKEESAAAKQLAEPLNGYRSNLLSAYGVASLQNENPEKATAYWISFGHYPGHKHRDALHFDLFTAKASLLPDFGYPESASADDPTRFAFYNNTVSHNTLVVDAKGQLEKSGRILDYAPGKFAQYLRAEAPDVYPGVSRYERSALVVEPEPGKLIALDVFRAAGGRQHDLFFHSAGEEAASNLDWVEQKTGTLAGETVEYATFYDDPRYQEKSSGFPTSFGGYRGSGYQYLTQVKSAPNRPGAALTLPVSKTSKLLAPGKGESLTLHPVADEGAETLFLSMGRPPRTQRGAPEQVVFLTRRKVAEGNSELKSQFVTVLENGATLMIESIAALKAPEGVAALRVKLNNSETLYVFDAEKARPEFELEGIKLAGQSGAVLMGANGEEKQRYLYNAQEPFRAEIAAVDLQKETLTLDREIPAEWAARGQFLQAGNGAYRIESADGRTIKLLEQSPIRGRFRFEKFNNSSRIGAVSPQLTLARGRLGLFAADGKSFLGVAHSQPSSTKLKVEAPAKVEPGQDYFLGECMPGDEVTIKR